MKSLLNEERSTEFNYKSRIQSAGNIRLQNLIPYMRRIYTPKLHHSISFEWKQYNFNFHSRFQIALQFIIDNKIQMVTLLSFAPPDIVQRLSNNRLSLSLSLDLPILITPSMQSMQYHIYY